MTERADTAISLLRDTGCGLQRYHSAFSRCTECPLPRCFDELVPADQRAVREVLKRVGAYLTEGKL